MTDTNKRTLRERKIPKNYESDNEDQDPWGYAKPTYSRPVSQQDLRNPPQQLNSQAKLLVQFLSSITKKLREYVAAHPKPQGTHPKELPIPRNLKSKVGEGGGEPQQRQGDSRQPKIDGSKGRKDPLSIRAQISGPSVSYTRNELLLSQCKALHAESLDKILGIEKSIKNQQPSDSNLSRLQGRKLSNQPNATNPPKKQQGMPKNGSKPASQPLAQGSLINQSNDNGKKTDTPSSGSKSSRTSGTDNKIFKRSAYHVAIAYHIYLKKMRQKGALESEIDPTFHARKMRESIKK